MLHLDEEDRLLLIPGPTPVHRRILSALALPTISHGSAAFAEVFRQTLRMLRSVMDLEGGRVFVFSGSGTLAQETAVLNFVGRSDRLLVASTGFFAGRMAEIAGAHGLNVEAMAVEWGQGIDPDVLRGKLEAFKPSVVALTHVETSTGVLTDLETVIPFIHEHGALALVDGVAALGGVPEPMDGLGIDILLSGAQKGLGVPPGLAILGVGEAAWAKRVGRKDPVKAFYCDLLRWEPSMLEPEKYFSTHPVNMIRALHEALGMIQEEGLEARFERHRQLAATFREGMTALGFELFTDAGHFAPTLSVFRTPPNTPSSSFRSRLAANGVVTAGGINDGEDRVIRCGHMGNVGPGEIATALDAVRRTLGAT